MSKTRIAALTLGMTLSAFTAGCSSTTTNSNANGNNVPSNTGVITNNNGNTNSAGVTATNTASTTGGDFDTRYNRNYNYNVQETDFGRTADEYGREAKNAGYNIGSGVKDRWIHFKTRGALLAADDLRESTINVDVDNNAVTLRGTVANQAQSKKAELVAKGIQGVTSVKNNLQIKPNDSMMTPGTGNTNGNMGGNMNHSGNMNHNGNMNH